MPSDDDKTLENPYEAPHCRLKRSRSDDALKRIERFVEVGFAMFVFAVLAFAFLAIGFLLFGVWAWQEM